MNQWMTWHDMTWTESMNESMVWMIKHENWHIQWREKWVYKDPYKSQILRQRWWWGCYEDEFQVSFQWIVLIKIKVCIPNVMNSINTTKNL